LNGISLDQISDVMQVAGMPIDGKMQLFDGQT
jgi:DNA-directed RNA polymerase beta subunit